MKALLLDAKQRSAHVKNTPNPQPSANELFIRVEAIALNPIDSRYTFHPLASTSRTIGSDFAGVVDALGDDVPPTSGLGPGDRVAGFLQGACSANERPGAFADYLVCPWDLVWKVGVGMRLQEAAAVSLCGLTAAQALFYRMGLEAPFSWPERPARTAGLEEHRPEAAGGLSFFVYGASTSVGLYAAQLVRRSAASSERRSIRLFGTAGQKHFEMLKAEPYSYDGLVDYHDEDWPAKIRGLTDGAGVDYAYDCISEGATVSKTGDTLAPGGKMAIVRSREGGAWTAPDLTVEPMYGAVWEGLGEFVQYQGMDLPASPEARSFAVAFYRWLSGGGRLKPNPLREMPGGLEAIVDEGFRLLGSGTMGDRDAKSEKAWMRPLSAEKMVYGIAAE
ncbi:hypothetical protein IMSHALPRED_003167 [Imshaugia aleurites]|uniref:Enoyl reductase (ER) domain-containing protein n=1 Tax=Imshaugia aleurites TaxID=172621 RepID=A0A8H3PJR4_9LECA|nr:hypothetical protein IMSHALPRED_003167 [Imshaugia aleurites]